MSSRILPCFFITIIFSLLLLFSATASVAQQVVPVGPPVGTTSTSGPANSTTAGDRNERHMCIYSAAELTTAGLVNGTQIMSIAWEKTGAAFYYDQNLTIRIWLKLNASATFPGSPNFATETAGATLVYQTTTASMPAAPGIMTFPFNTATPFFTWDGIQNLQVITELVRPTDWTATGFLWRTINSVTNAAANASGTIASPPATLTRTGTRPQIRVGIPAAGVDAALVGMPLPVSAPAGVQNIDVQLRNTGNTTLTTADVGWTINGGASTNFPWSGSLAVGAITTITIGSPSFALGTNIIQATVSNPNGSADVDPSNNVITKTILTCSPLSGAYTINQGLPTGGTNYNSFNDFSAALSNCGVGGNVTATVTAASGPYTEQVVFQNIPGIGSGATVTIQGNAETITSDTAILSTASNPNRHIIRLNGLQYFTINNLQVDMVAGSTAFIGIHGLNSGNHVTISNCDVDMGTSTSALIAGVVFNGDPSGNLTPGGAFDFITITGNTFTGGSFGVALNGLVAPLATNVVISNNNVNNFSSNGVYLRESNGVQVSGNHFDKAAGSTGSTNAIQLAQAANINGRIFGNFIKMSQTTGSLVGIYLFNGTGHRVYNNLIYDINSTTGDIEGIRVRTGGTAPEIYFNTISFDNAAATSGSLRGFREELGNTNSILRNNIFSMTQPSTDKAALELAASSTITTAINSNYNVFWVPGGNVATKIQPNPNPVLFFPTLSDWQTASTQDAASFEVNPFFVAVTNPIPTSGVINNQAVTGTGITDDITGAVRGVAPDPGAYEFSPPSGDAAITDFISPPKPHCGTTLNVQFELTNAGGDPLNSVTINWTVNGVPQTPVNWTGPTLASGASTIVTLGIVPVTGANLYTFTATSSNPNGGVDVNPSNDSFTFTGFRRGLEGAFTINSSAPSSSTNYLTFQSIANDLSEHGICTPVTITVMNGPYTEQVVFNVIPGSSSTNTVTLDGNGSVLQFNPTVAVDDHILQLNGVTHMIVEDLTVNSLHPTQGRGIHITNNASKLTIRNNTVNVSKINSTSISFGIIISGENWLLDGSLSDSVIITGNTVSGGYSAIQLSGVHWTTPLTRIRVINNNALDWYGFGIYVSYTNGVVVSGNTIRRPTRTNSGSDAVTPAGITIPAGSENFMVDKNRIYDLEMAMPGTPTISRGIYLSGTAIAHSWGTIQNNLIYGMRNDGAQYGIQHNSLNAPINIYHNTIVLDGPTGASTSNTNAINMSNSTAQSGTDIRNNLFFVTRGGTGIKRIYDITSGASQFISNYNVTWLNAPGGIQTFGQYGSNTYNTLDDWQTGTSKDINSVFANPVFVNPPTGNYAPTEVLVDGATMGTVSVGVLDDILGTPRSATPDPGAYEFIPPPCTGAVGGTASTTAGPFCSTGSGTITASGYSTGVGSTYQWEWSTDNFVANVNDLTGQINPASANTGTIIATTYYRLRVTCTSGPATAYSNIVTITVNQPVSITTQPSSQNVCAGSDVTFTVVATNAVSYQWIKGSTTIPGATGSSYTIISVSAADVDSYTVIVTGNAPCSPVTSNAAVLTIGEVTAIITQPASQAVCIGSNVTFTVTAVGAGLTYQWRKGGVDISGATTASYTINSATAGDAGNYDVVVTGSCGTGTSSVATLSVNATGSWIGVTSTNWNTASNWCGAVPTATTDVIIPAGAPNMPNLSAGTGEAHNITINGGASLTIGAGGTLNIYGDLTNNGSFNAAAGNLGFRGSASQSIAGFTTINALMDGTGGIVLNGNASITGILTLSNGNISLGTNHLTLAGNTSGSPGSHIITNNSGDVIVSSLAASTSRVIPVGIDATSYNPVTLSANAGHIADNFIVNLKQGVFENGVSGVLYNDYVVDRTWTINEATAGGSNVNVTLQWNAAHELTGFDRSRCYVMQHTGVSWLAGASSPASGANPFTQTRNGVTSFSPFAVRTEPIPQPSTGIYPNPTNSILNVVLNLTGAGPVQFRIYDAAGKLVKQVQVNLSSGLTRTVLDLNKLSTGMYILKVSNATNLEVMAEKFVKQF